MFGKIISLLPNSPYSSIRDLVTSRQRQYPSNWFYKPVGIEVEITNKCNLKCAGCGQRDEHSRPEDILTTDEYIDIILQASRTPIFACSLTGGETLLFLEHVKKILAAVHTQIDIYKINSNSYRFVNDEITLKVLKDLKVSGFGNNRFIKSVIVTSIGQQNEDGMPLKNSVNLVRNFYKIFNFDQALCTVNSTDRDLKRANFWLKAFKKLYLDLTGEALDESLVPFRAFMLNNVPTLERLDLMIKFDVAIPELFKSFKQQYSSWLCLNVLPEAGDVTTLTPRCVLRPNGDLIACPGYNYVHKIGNLKEQSLWQILEAANQDVFLQKVFTGGLPAVYEHALAKVPELADTKLSLSYSPCDLCQYFKNALQPAVASV